MIKWTGLAPWDFESPFPGSLTSNPQIAKQQVAAGLKALRSIAPDRPSTILHALPAILAAGNASGADG